MNNINTEWKKHASTEKMRQFIPLGIEQDIVLIRLTKKCVQ